MEKTKVISVCDTIHDFDLKNNKFYDAFVQEHNIPSSGKIEKYIMNYMNIDKNDDNETIDLEYVRQTNLPYFTSRTYDITSKDFKTLLWSMCNSHYQPNEDINIIADATLLPYSLLCNFGNEIKTPNLLLTEAAKYDRLIDKPTDCLRNRPTTASLFKSNGNLFGLNFITVETINGTQLMKYSYNTTGVHQIALDKYIYEQRLVGKKLKPFLADVVTNMYKRYFNKKRKESTQALNHTTDLLTLLNKVEKVYKLKHTDFGFYNKDTDTVTFDEYSKQYVNILFDFKRAGDQLQIESAKQSNSIFLSNDQVAITYAYHIGVPCIKTSRFGSCKKDNDEIAVIDDDDDDPGEIEENETRRKLVYYNLSKDAVINALDNKEYYTKMIEIWFEQLENYFYFLTAISQTYDIEKIKRIQSLIFNTMLKSMDMLKLNPKQDKERESARSKGRANTNKGMYKYRYFHKFNAIMHGFLWNVLNHIMYSQNTIKEYTDYQNEYQTSDKSLESLKTMHNKMQNNVIYKFIKCLNINDDRNTDYFQLIFKYYNNNLPTIRILYDKQDPTMNLYTMMEPKISISNYILANTAKYPAISSKPLNKQKNEINTLIFKQYNDAINDVVMDIQLAMPIFQNFLDLKNELEKQSSLQKQQSFFSIDGDSESNGELDTKKTKIILETFMQSDLENDKSKVSKLLRKINEDISKYKDMIDSLFKPNFVDEFILEPEPPHNQVQSGGDEQPTHYTLFVKELDYIYNNRDAVTNDFTKLLLIFFVKSSDIFRANGTFSKSFTKFYCRKMTSLRSKPNSVIKSSSKRSTVSTPVSISKPNSVKASSSKRSVASAASTIEPIRKYNSKLQSSSTRSAASTLKQNSQIS